MADFSYDEDNGINDMIEPVITNTGHRSTGAPVTGGTLLPYPPVHP
jgi:hypothetical protein